MTDAPIKRSATVAPPAKGVEQGSTPAVPPRVPVGLDPFCLCREAFCSNCNYLSFYSPEYLILLVFLGSIYKVIWELMRQVPKLLVVSAEKEPASQRTNYPIRRDLS